MRRYALPASGACYTATGASPAPAYTGRQTHIFNGRDKNGQRTDFDNCIGCYCNVFRFNEHGELVYYTDRYSWSVIRFHENATELAKAADYLLEQALEHQHLIPKNRHAKERNTNRLLTTK